MLDFVTVRTWSIRVDARSPERHAVAAHDVPRRMGYQHGLHSADGIQIVPAGMASFDEKVVVVTAPSDP